MKRVALVSDSHVPKRATGIPDWVKEEIRSADHTIHAGDYDSREALETVRELTDSLTCVSGNMDPSLGLPDLDTAIIGDVEFVVMHGDRPGGRFEDYVAKTAKEHASKDAAVGVAGHTHEVLDTVVDGVRILNPGSCTGARPGTETSMMRLSVEGDSLDVDVLKK